MSGIFGPGDRQNEWQTIGDMLRRIARLEAVRGGGGSCDGGIDSTENVGDDCGVHSIEPDDTPEAALSVLFADGVGGSTWQPRDFVGSYDSLVLGDPDLLAYWRMTDDLLDYSPYAPRTLTNYSVVGPTYSSTLGPGIEDGHTNGCYVFDGSTNELENSGAGAPYGLAANLPFTYEFMIWPDSTDAGGFVLCNFSQVVGSSAERGHQIFLTSGRAIQFQRILVGSTITTTTPLFLDADTWSHVVISYDGTTVRVYFDGALVVSNTDTNTQSSNSNPAIRIGGFTIGLHSPGAGRNFKGRLGRIAIYGVALTAQEVVEHAYSASALSSTVVSTATQVIAGAGLTGGGSLTENVTFAVNADGSTLEIAADVLQVKDAGVTEAKIGLSDVTTNDSSTTKHGFLRKLSNVSTEVMTGTGAWTSMSTLANPANDTQVWMPLTTVVGGAPELVWSGTDSLIPTLIPI